MPFVEYKSAREIAREGRALARGGQSMREVCAMLGIDSNAGWQMVKEGKLIAVKAGGRVVIVADSVAPRSVEGMA